MTAFQAHSPKLRAGGTQHLHVNSDERLCPPWLRLKLALQHIMEKPFNRWNKGEPVVPNTRNHIGTTRDTVLPQIFSVRTHPFDPRHSLLFETRLPVPTTPVINLPGLDISTTDNQLNRYVTNALQVRFDAEALGHSCGAQPPLLRRVKHRDAPRRPNRAPEKLLGVKVEKAVGKVAAARKPMEQEPLSVNRKDLRYLTNHFEQDEVKANTLVL